MTKKPLERIMHVEDELDIQQIVKLALEDIGGFKVETCSSGGEALAKLLDFAPDLILLDVMMPELDGPETLRRLRDMPEFSNTPVVFMTAKAQAHEVQHFRALGAADVIVKPFDPIELPETILGIWRKFSG